jgi:hypothetical protein
MVISGMISMEEASAIRKKVVDNRHTIQRAFSDIHLKSNTELLSELRLFMHKPTEYATITSASSSIAYSHLVINVSPALHNLLILAPFDIHLSHLEDIIHDMSSILGTRISSIKIK